MPENNKGKMGPKLPVIDFSKCRNCKLCIETCPENVIKVVRKDSCAKCVKYCMTMQVPCVPEKIVFDYEHCNKCGKCIDVCPEKAIYWFTVKNSS